MVSNAPTKGSGWPTRQALVTIITRLKTHLVRLPGHARHSTYQVLFLGKLLHGSNSRPTIRRDSCTHKNRVSMVESGLLFVLIPISQCRAFYFDRDNDLRSNLRLHILIRESSKIEEFLECSSGCPDHLRFKRTWPRCCHHLQRPSAVQCELFCQSLFVCLL